MGAVDQPVWDAGGMWNNLDITGCLTGGGRRRVGGRKASPRVPFGFPYISMTSNLVDLPSVRSSSTSSIC